MGGVSLDGINCDGGGGGVQNPDALGNHLYLLMEGVWAARRMFGAESPVQDVASAVRVLVGV
ncbi:MAG: hypothetical protein F9K46_13605 [Anaerolineae bacterium]|nr:MAG: hypothetical protein F9K46_13605 [Anaerolineae bacterium]